MACVQEGHADELLKPCVTNADQGILAGGKEGVARYEQDHGDDPHQDEGEQKPVSPEKDSW